jgi:hypothetical protein
MRLVNFEEVEKMVKEMVGGKSLGLYFFNISFLGFLGNHWKIHLGGH